MKKKKLIEQIEILTHDYNELKKSHSDLLTQAEDLSIQLSKSRRLAEDMKYKLIKYTDVTLDDILNLSEDEINDKLMRFYKDKLQPKTKPLPNPKPNS